MTPLYKVQEAALGGDRDAVRELGRRYAETGLTAHLISDKQKARIAAMYEAGWLGEPNPYEWGRGGNFARPLWSAHFAGQRDRKAQSAESAPVSP